MNDWQDKLLNSEIQFQCNKCNFINIYYTIDVFKGMMWKSVRNNYIILLKCLKCNQEIKD